jgi:hypothetical protein
MNGVPQTAGQGTFNQGGNDGIKNLSRIKKNLLLIIIFRMRSVMIHWYI